MATETITINVNTPAGLTVVQFRNTLCTYWGYQETVPDPANPGQTIPNPQGKAAFVKKRVADFLKESYRAQKAREAVEAARLASLAETDQVGVD